MANYNAPGVYMESVSNATKSVVGVSSDIFGFVGVTPRGDETTPIYVTSWNNFIEKCAGGLDSPFMADHDLAYAVYGFFQNGGTRAYISRVVRSDCEKSYSQDKNPSMQAKDAGVWGKNLQVHITPNIVDATLFDVKVTLKGKVVENFTGLTNDKTKSNYAFDEINGRSNFVRFDDEEDCTLSEKIVKFSGGLASGENGAEVNDNDYISAIERMKQVDELGFICVPGVTTSSVVNKLKEFVEAKNRYTVAIVDMPLSVKTKEAALEFRKSVISDSMAIVEPYGYVTDPLSPSGRLRLVPPSGHWCGYEAKNIHKNGIQKAPAGTEATITGFTALDVNYSMEDLEILNPAGIITLVNKKNYGIVIWGCRSCSSDPNYKYITDKIVDNYIDGSIYNGTQWAVFEDNDEDLWDSLATSVTEFLETCRQNGIIKGNTPASSYYVNCNEDLNTETVQREGKVICEYGFAKKKPAEFVVHRVDHNMANTTTETA